MSIGRKVLVENRVGAGGVVAATSVKRAQPDGHTLLIANSGTHAVMGSLQAVSYNAIDDYAPIMELFYMVGALTVPVNLPVNSVAELIALARSKPGGLAYGSQGLGSGGHLYAIMLQLATGAPLTHVPYAGGSAMNIDLIAGRIEMAFTAYNAIKEYLAAGQVKVLAVTSETRSPFMPAVPTMAEAGYPEIDMDTWYGLVAPAGTPGSIVKKLNQEFARAARDPEVIRKMDLLGVGQRSTNPTEFAALIARDSARMGKIIKDAGIRPN